MEGIRNIETELFKEANKHSFSPEYPKRPQMLLEMQVFLYDRHFKVFYQAVYNNNELIGEWIPYHGLTVEVYRTV